MANIYFSQELGIPFLKPVGFSKQLQSLSETSRLNLVNAKTLIVNSPPIERCVETIEGLSILLNTLIAAEDRRSPTSRTTESTRKQHKQLQEKLRVDSQVLTDSFSKQLHYLNRSSAFEKL